MRYLLHMAIVLFFWCVPASAQQALLTAELNEEETLVGQPVTLTITILVPTWMSGETNFPNLEVPGIMVRLPERAGGPVSEDVDGETWSGVRRRYQLFPLEAGTFQIPRQQVSIAYADPDTQAPIEADLVFDGASFRAGRPESAADLDPLIVAKDFSLTQQFEGETDLAPGDAITRTLTAEIDGTTPVIIPQLSPEFESDLMRGYGAEPSVEEMDNRGQLSGSRTEKTTYIAQGPGSITIPGISLDWFDLDSGEVKTVSVPEQAISITGTALGEQDTLDAGFIIRLVIGLIVALLLLLGLRRYAWPPAQRWMVARHQRWRASEPFAHRQVLKAIRSKQLGALSACVDQWLDHVPQECNDIRTELSAALARLGAPRFGTDAGRPANWSQFRASYLALRAKVLRHQRRDTHALPGLNPDWGG